MMTKREFCVGIIQKYLDDNNRFPSDSMSIEEYLLLVNDKDAMNNSAVAVAMEYLGVLESEEAKKYASTHTGVVFNMCGLGWKKGEVFLISGYLTVREIISLLPEKSF